MKLIEIHGTSHDGIEGTRWCIIILGICNY